MANIKITQGQAESLMATAACALGVRASSDYEYIMWFHDGERGTKSHTSPLGRFEAVLIGETPCGDKFTVGKRVS